MNISLNEYAVFVALLNATSDKPLSCLISNDSTSENIESIVQNGKLIIDVDERFPPLLTAVDINNIDVICWLIKNVKITCENDFMLFFGYLDSTEHTSVAMHSIYRCSFSEIKEIIDSILVYISEELISKNVLINETIILSFDALYVRIQSDDIPSSFALSLFSYAVYGLLLMDCNSNFELLDYLLSIGFDINQPIKVCFPDKRQKNIGIIEFVSMKYKGYRDTEHYFNLLRYLIGKGANTNGVSELLYTCLKIKEICK